MSMHRLCGFLLILVEAVATGFLSHTYIFPACIVLCTAVGAFTPLRLHTRRTNESRIYYLIAITFVVAYFALPSPFQIRQNFLRTTEAFFLAQGILTAQVIQFFFYRSDNRLPSTLSGFGAVVMICVFSIIANPLEQKFTLGFVVAFIAATIAFSTTCRGACAVKGERHWGQWATSIIALIVVSVMVCTTSMLVYNYAHELDELLVELTSFQNRRGRTGFSGRANLGSVAHRKSNEPTEIALRIYAKQAPGYLRGKAFDTYSGSKWQAWTGIRALQPAKAGDHPGAGNVPFFIHHGASQDYANATNFECWPEADLHGSIVTPWGTEAIRVDLEEVDVDSHGIFQSSFADSIGSYTACIPQAGMDGSASKSSESADTNSFWKTIADPNPDFIERLKEVPEHLSDNSEIQLLVKTIFANCSTTADHVQAVEMYFQSTYQYQIGIDIPAGQDPLEFFLTRRPAAHCEYFASGATILLRMAGIPCRYVTGFVPTQKNDFGDYWIARNSDAHAWVEAYDPTGGWYLVEATPSAGQPQPTPLSRWQELKEFLSARFREIRTAIQHGQWRQMLVRLIDDLNGPAGWCVIVFLILFLFRRSLRQLFNRKATIEMAPEILELHQLLSRMDRRLKKKGITRQAGETLHQFSNRLEALSQGEHDLISKSQWYRDYAQLRYGGQRDSASISRLSQRI